MAPFSRLLYLADPRPDRQEGAAWAREVADLLGGLLSIRRSERGAWEPHSPLEGPWDVLLKVPRPGPRMLPRRLAREDRELLRRAPAPVWFFHPERIAAGLPVLAAVGVGGTLPSPADREVLRTATHLSRRMSSPLVVVRPWSLVGDSILASPRRGLSPGRYRALVSRAAEEHREELGRTVAAEVSGVPVTSLVRKGAAEGVLVDSARRTGAGVVVLDAAAAVDPVHGVFGRLAERLLRRTSSSLFLSRSSPPDLGWPAASGDRGRLPQSHGAE